MPDSSTPVRVRFAPSPTGLLHIGGLRTALYNYLFARRFGGQFVLRIEDTDRERFVAEAEDDILTALRWAGLEYDEGPGKDGGVGPYRQSERKAYYDQYVQQLLEAGHAYHAFDTPEEIEAMRAARQQAGLSAGYNAETRGRMQNALTLSEDDVQRRLADGQPAVVRMKVPVGETVAFNDLVRGGVSFDTAEVDDQVLLKSDGMPTYHLANVVDDHLMRISHVIRGEEWLSSTPKHLLLYRFLGWRPPQMAHLPLIMSPTGGKLSKRNAEKMGIPINVRQYRAEGYEPAALINFLALLGWNPGNDEELFTLSELSKLFSLDRVGSSGVQFDLDKLRWYNGQYVRAYSPAEFAQRARPYLEAAGYHPDPGSLLAVASLMQERVEKIDELPEAASYFFEPPRAYDEKGVKKRWKDDSAALLTAYAERLEQVEHFSAEQAEQVLRELAEEREVGAGRIIHPTRLALSGVTGGPSLFDLMEVLGREACVERLRTAVQTLG